MLARLCLLGCLALGQATDPTELGASSFPSAGGNSFVSFESVGVAGTSVADHYRATKGCVFSNTSAQASEWARNGSFVAANAPVGCWGDKPMSFSFVVPNSHVPATVTRVGFFVTGMSRSVTINLHDADGELIKSYSKLNGQGYEDAANRWYGFEYPQGIAKVIVNSASYAIDSLKFNTPTAVSDGIVTMASESIFSADHAIGFESVGGAGCQSVGCFGSSTCSPCPEGKIVGKFYENQGVVFESGNTIATEYSRSNGFSVGTGEFGKFGSRDMTFSFVLKGTEVPAYVSRVGFYVSGESPLVTVTLFDITGQVISTKHVASEASRDASRWYGFEALGIAKVVVSASSYAIDDLRFSNPVMIPTMSVATTSAFDSMTITPSATFSHDQYRADGVVFTSGVGGLSSVSTSVRFVKKSFVPATVDTVGVLTQSTSNVVMYFFDQEGVLADMKHISSGTFAYFSFVGIAKVMLVGENYEVEKLTYGSRVPYTEGSITMASIHEFDSSDKQITFDSVAGAACTARGCTGSSTCSPCPEGKAVASHYKHTDGIRFTNTSTLSSQWARSGGFVATNGDFGAWGTKPMAFEFLAHSQNINVYEAATVTQVGFYVTGRAKNVQVTLYDTVGTEKGTFSLECNSDANEKRWYGFTGTGIHKVSVSGSSYAIDDVRFDAPSGILTDCVTTDWTTNNVCSQSCGTGSAVHTRTVTTAPVFGGAGCGALKHKTVCNDHPCPIDCVVSGFANWAPCSKSCGTGTRAHHRSISVDSVYGGKACPLLNATEPCNSHDCPIDCELSEWGGWNACSANCGTGSQNRTRVVLIAKAGGGKECADKDETQFCNRHACKADCSMTKWGGWSACDRSCGNGYSFRNRTITSAAVMGGAGCNHTTESMRCNEHDCPVDCEVTDWSVATHCTRSCGGGWEHRYRSVAVAVDFGGVGCPTLTDSVQCNNITCPEDCVVEDWPATWEPCTEDCGGGTQTRTRARTSHELDGGKTCPHLTETRVCNIHGCPVDCEISSGFGSWQTCDKTCGTNATGYGRQKRETYKVHDQAFGGHACPADWYSVGWQDCDVQVECPVNCIMSTWEGEGTDMEWSTCTEECGGGTQFHTRTIISNETNGGLACPALQELQACNVANCKIDCVMGQWSNWTSCSRSCGVGESHRGRPVLTVNSFGGQACDSHMETKKCNIFGCPVDCEHSEWSAYGTCTTSCGSGSQEKTRSVTQPPRYGGNACGDLAANQTCNAQECPIDCVVHEYGNWTECSVGCGGGKSHQYRAMDPASFGGIACTLPYRNSKDCNMDPCPVHCVVAWLQEHDWSPCSRTCGNGTSYARSTVIQGAQHGGNGCGVLDHERSCNADPCPVDCDMEPWSDWTGCTKTCDQGFQGRERKILTHPDHGGAACESKTPGGAAWTSDARFCNEQCCPVDCEMTNFNEWSTCSDDCHANNATAAPRRSRSRSVITAMSCLGKPCDSLDESELCNTHQCPINCVLSAWSDYSSCSKTCGTGGIQIRTRYILVDPVHNGTSCEALEMNTTCANISQCPSHCEVSEWSAWGTCSEDCGTGTWSRSRSIVQQVMFQGRVCPHLDETGVCNTHACAVNCQENPWTEFGDCSGTCNDPASPPLRTKTRTIKFEAQHGGTACSPELSIDEPCNRNVTCPVDCLLSQWSDYSECSRSCGHGGKTRTRSIVIAAAHGGKPCDNNTAVESPCFVSVCPVDCVFTNFTEWDACSLPCGGGVRRRTRTITNGHADYHGEICPATVETESCNDAVCPTPCKEGAWSSFSSCSQTCGPGSRTRSRTPDVQPSTYGTACGAQSESIDCFIGICAVDCNVTEWSEWSICSSTCGEGTKSRSRSVLVDAVNGRGEVGRHCPSLSDYESCDNLPVCPVDCKLTFWSGLDTCKDTAGVAITCGTGTRSKSRIVVSQAVGTGLACPDSGSSELIQSYPCSKGPCAVHCDVSNFTEWSACDRNCGGGAKGRSRSVITRGDHGGTVCPDLSETDTCNTQPCCRQLNVQLLGTSSAMELNAPMEESVIITHGYGWNDPGAICVDDWRNKTDTVPSVVGESQLTAAGKYTITYTCAMPAACGGGSATAIRIVNVETMRYHNGTTNTSTKLTGAPTKSPTAHPTSSPTDLRTCQNGQDTVAPGWNGTGYGANSCNLCKCHDGLLKCQQRSCSTTDSLCSHTTCSFKESMGHDVMVVQHNGSETVGSSHHCQYSQFTKNCECRCSGAAMSTPFTVDSRLNDAVRAHHVKLVAMQSHFQHVPNTAAHMAATEAAIVAEQKRKADWMRDRDVVGTTAWKDEQFIEAGLTGNPHSQLASSAAV